VSKQLNLVPFGYTLKVNSYNHQMEGLIYIEIVFQYR